MDVDSIKWRPSHPKTGPFVAEKDSEGAAKEPSLSQLLGWFVVPVN